MATPEQVAEFRSRIHELADEMPEEGLLDSLEYLKANKQLFTPEPSPEVASAA